MNPKTFKDQISEVLDSPSSRTMMLQKQKYSDQTRDTRKLDQFKVTPLPPNG